MIKCNVCKAAFCTSLYGLQSISTKKLFGKRTRGEEKNIFPNIPGEGGVNSFDMFSCDPQKSKPLVFKRKKALKKIILLKVSHRPSLLLQHLLHAIFKK